MRFPHPRSFYFCWILLTIMLFFSLLFLLLSLLCNYSRIAQLCTAHIGNSVYYRWNERCSAQKILKHADTEHIESKDDQITVWCAYAHFANSIIIFIVWSLLAILCIFPIRLRWFFISVRAASECIEQTDIHSHAHILQENALFHVRIVCGVFCMWNDVCSIAMLLLLAHSLAARGCVVWMTKQTVKGRATLKRKPEWGEDGKGIRNKYSLLFSSQIQ